MKCDICRLEKVMVGSIINFELQEQYKVCSECLERIKTL